MAMSDWMQSVTGRTNAEHQAWRDNYNGGWAAGDFTGNVNREIAWERAATGEDNPEIRARLPEGLTPEMISGKSTSNPNRGGSSSGGSGGQGASPSQSGKPSGTSGGSGKGSSALPGMPSRVGAFGVPTTNPDLFGKLFARGNVAHPMDELEKHGQLVLNGVAIKHDPGFSPAMVIEDIYGEIAAAVYGAIKAGADANATFGLDSTLDAQRAPWEQLGRDFRDATVKAYQDAEKHWNAAVDWAAENIPKGYESTPGNANPYSGGSPWSTPFN